MLDDPRKHDTNRNSNNDFSGDLDPTLIRYFAGDLSAEERAAFERWLAAEPARVPMVQRLRAIWDASEEIGEEPNTEAALTRVEDQATRRRAMLVPMERPMLRLPRVIPTQRQATAISTYAWRVAAALVLLTGLGVLWRAERAQDAAVAPAARTYVTARGERATITLADGSTVMLNTESTLEVPAAFGAGPRAVTLRGEAYFVVAHDSVRPFRVRAGRAVTQVLGTKFVVRARPGEDTTRVAVAEGRVAVGDAVLRQGDLGIVGADDSVTVRVAVDARPYLGWTEGELVFDAAPLPAVLTELSRWYDRDFVLVDSAIARLRLTTVFGQGSVEEAVRVLEASLKVRAHVQGRRILLARARPTS